MSKTKITSKASKKKAVKSAKLVGSTTTRKSSRSRRSANYKQGKPLLQIAYDVVGNGFTFIWFCSLSSCFVLNLKILSSLIILLYFK